MKNEQLEELRKVKEAQFLTLYFKLSKGEQELFEQKYGTRRITLRGLISAIDWICTSFSLPHPEKEKVMNLIKEKLGL
jgi:hypothetical protein